jgi:hypothetical protein
MHSRSGGGEDTISEVVNNPTPMHNAIRRLTKCHALTTVRERDGNDEDAIDIPVRFILLIPRTSFLNQIGLPNYPRVRIWRF